MDYVSIFDPIPWAAVGHSIVQTLFLYWTLLFGIKVAGRRVFAEMGPQDLVVLLLVAEACDLGLSDETAGFWGTLFSVLTILVTGAVVERIPFLRTNLESEPVELVRGGRLVPRAMASNMVDEHDLAHAARRYGFASFDDFDVMILESDGSITGVVSQGARSGRRLKNPPGE